jgi:hypothetical protein
MNVCEYCYSPLAQEECEDCGSRYVPVSSVSTSMTNKKPESNNISYLPALSEGEYSNVIDVLEEKRHSKG